MAIKYGSRKFIILVICIFLTILIPLVFNVLKMDSSVIITTMSLVNGLSGLYFGANIAEKRWGNHDPIGG